MSQKHGAERRKISSIWIDGINGDQLVHFEFSGSRTLILHGRNGSGKTQALRIIDSILNVNLLVLSYYKFETALIRYEDDTEIVVSYVDSFPNSRKGGFSFSWGKGKETSTELIEIELLERAVRNELHAVRAEPDSFYWVFERESRGLSSESGRLVSSDDLQERLNVLTTFEKIIGGNSGVLARIAKIRTTLLSAHCQFIGTHRLVANAGIRHFGTNHKLAKLSRFLPIQGLASRMVEYIQESLKEVERLRSKFDSEFPTKIFELETLGYSPFVDIADSFERIYDERMLFKEQLGIGFEPMGFAPNEATELDPALRKVASLYLKGQYEQMAPLRQLLERVDIFKRLVNGRLWRKSIAISQEFGLRVHPRDSKSGAVDYSLSIPLEKLSTGEQHEIYLFFNLVFADDNPALILIDEPEISLHVAWQRSFINDILEASRFTNPRFIIATHSPQIIGSREDQLVTFVSHREPLSGFGR